MCLILLSILVDIGLSCRLVAPRIKDKLFEVNILLTSGDKED